MGRVIRIGGLRGEDLRNGRRIVGQSRGLAKLRILILRTQQTPGGFLMIKQITRQQVRLHGDAQILHGLAEKQAAELGPIKQVDLCITSGQTHRHQIGVEFHLPAQAPFTKIDDPPHEADDPPRQPQDRPRPIGGESAVGIIGHPAVDLARGGAPWTR